MGYPTGVRWSTSSLTSSPGNHFCKHCLSILRYESSYFAPGAGVELSTYWCPVCEMYSQFPETHSTYVPSTTATFTYKYDED